MSQDPRIKVFMQIFIIALTILLLLQYVMFRDAQIPETTFTALLIGAFVSPRLRQ
jgi:hypothetical protein